VAPATSLANGIIVSQQYSNSTDPFNKTLINLTPTPLGGYADTLIVTSCIVQNSAGKVVTDPSCASMTNTTLAGGNTAVPFAISASNTAPVDVYTVTLTLGDTVFPTLSHTVSLQTYVVDTAPAITLAPGFELAESVTFNTAPPPGGTLATSLVSFTCGKIVTLSGGDANVANEITCSGAGSVPITGNATVAAITILANGSGTVSMNRNHSSESVFSAAFWGVPLLALLAWLGNRKSPRRNFFRFLGMLLLIVGLSHAIGCGGSFHRPTSVTTGTTPGSYLIQVVATDSNKQVHSVVVPLVVN
jgi:hypothetical protein